MQAWTHTHTHTHLSQDPAVEGEIFDSVFEDIASPSSKASLFKTQQLRQHPVHYEGGGGGGGGGGEG